MRRAVISFALVVLVALVGCTRDPWARHPMPSAPDRACRTGGGAGHDVWIWTCTAGRHVVVSQYCGGFVGCQEAEREEVACGEKTPLETRIAMYLGQDCRPVPETKRWPQRD